MPNNEKHRGMGWSHHTTSPSSTSQRKNHLLVIGIDKYQNFTPLNNAVKDAKDFIAVLQNKYQFDKNNLTCLFNEEATRSNIIETFSTLLNKLTNNDNLIFYYSGHGEQLEYGNGQRGYWIPCDAKTDMTSSYIPNEEINILFKNSDAHHIFGIVDSCYSGSLFRSSGVSKAESRIDSYPSRWLLSAGRNEVVSDGAIGQNSPFANSLLAYLKNNPSKGIWVYDLCQKVIESTSFNAQQTPRGEPLPGVGHEGGQFIFRQKGFYEDVNNNVSTIVAPPTFEHRTTEKPIPKSFASSKLIIGISSILLISALFYFFKIKGNTTTKDQEPIELVNKYIKDNNLLAAINLVNEHSDNQELIALIDDAKQKFIQRADSLVNVENYSGALVEYKFVDSVFKSDSHCCKSQIQSIITPKVIIGKTFLRDRASSVRVYYSIDNETTISYGRSNSSGEFMIKNEKFLPGTKVKLIAKKSNYKDATVIKNIRTKDEVKATLSLNQKNSSSNISQEQVPISSPSISSPSQSEVNNTNESNTTTTPPVIKYYSVKLIVNQEFSNAEIFVDGEPAVILEDTPSIKTVEVKEKRGSYKFELKKGGNIKEKNQAIRKSNQKIYFNN